MIRRFGTVLALACASVACFEADSGEDEIAETGTSSESTGEGESTSEESTSEESTSEESTSEESTSEESTTGDPEPVCGNGMVEGEEVCDDGPMPELMPGACAPDCSKVIDVKHAVLGNWIVSTNFGNNPVAYADSTCPIGYNAMFAYGNLRVATTGAWQTVDAVDWPIQRYTAYVNNQDELLWVTDDTRMLAIRDGQKQSPLNPLYTCDPICIDQRMVNGMADDGTTAVSDNCNGWTSTDGNLNFSVGEFFGFDLNDSLVACAADTAGSQRFLCIEQ
jgi:hypothetical protein